MIEQKCMDVGVHDCISSQRKNKIGLLREQLKFAQAGQMGNAAIIRGPPEQWVWHVEWELAVFENNDGALCVQWNNSVLSFHFCVGRKTVKKK